MASGNQMKRGKNQSLFKYLPETWIDFSARGKERKQYIAKVVRWNSEKLDGINAKRLIRTVDSAVRSFEEQENPSSSIPSVSGFGAELTIDNCDVLTPKASEEERGIVAKISPLTFYCRNCYRVYQFNNEDDYRRNQTCKNPKCNHAELAQFRQIYYCKCGYATDKHNPYCSEHGYQFIKWDKGYNFYCTKCQKRIPMQAKCKVCGSILTPKVALDPAAFFVFSLGLIDLIDEKVENFIAETEYGAFTTFLYWLGKITYEELQNIITTGIVIDKDRYNDVYNQYYQMMLVALNGDENSAKSAATAVAQQTCGNQYISLIDDLKGNIFNESIDLSNLAERILEYTLVSKLDDVSNLDSAISVAKLLNTSANPEAYKNVAEKYGISNAFVCDRIPFITCSYGYTRAESECGEGVQLRALKEEKAGRKNIYATKLNTEGVLFEFDRKRIIEWLLKNDFISLDSAPDLESDESIKIWFINYIKPSIIKSFSQIDDTESKPTYYVYRLIHTLSHLLIKAAADIGGLGKDSLSEYIFPGIPAVLIYCQNSQGFSLGSLFNLFEAHFDLWMDTAYKNAQKCVFDPICMEKHKACTGCLFVNEVSCQHFNKDLDRSLIVGHFDRETKKNTYGFWEE